MKTGLCAVAATALVLAGASARATEWHWSWTPGQADGMYSVSNAGGTIHGIHASFDDQTNRLAWQAVFSDQLAEGFSLMLTPGDAPASRTGELAMIYFDASRVDFDNEGGPIAPVISIYGFNGINSNSTYYDGTPNPGTQAADRILSGEFAGRRLGETSYAYDNDLGQRVLGFSMDVTEIQEHDPRYPGPASWTGLAFGIDHAEDAGRLGVQFRTRTNLQTTYNGNGFLMSWTGDQGRLDGEGFHAVPTPATAVAMSLGCGLLARRRR